MPTLYAILGDEDARKSSTVRALTGVPQRKEVAVATTSGNIDVFVQISALQESGIMPQQFISEMNKKHSEHILVTLWISPLRKGGVTHPAGVDYLAAFIAAGWRISHVAVLAAPQLPGRLPQGVPLPHSVANARAMPVNQIASQLRAAWGWL